MEIEISKINVKPDDITGKKMVIPGLDGKPFNPFEPIWKKVINTDGKKEQVSTNPAAFIIDEQNKFRLKITLLMFHVEPGKYTLRGYWGNSLEMKEKPFFSGDFTIAGNKNDNLPGLFLVDVDVSVNFKPGTFFGLSGEFFWEVARESNKQATLISQSTYLELYWLFAGDFSIFRLGVPVEILRYLSIVCNTLYLTSNPGVNIEDLILALTRGEKEENRGNDRETGSIREKINIPDRQVIAAEIVTACFNRNPPCYDIYHGSPHFIYHGFSSKKQHMPINIALQEYLQAIRDPYALCNCHDQAALLIVHLMAAGLAGLKFCIMRPFGYLRLTSLVGQGLCNNPAFQGDMLRKIVYETDQSRTFFGLHAFCIWRNQGRKEVVLDSCIGPHTGDSDKAGYVDKTVDHLHPGNGGSTGKPEDIKEYNPVILLDYLTPIKELGDSQPLEDFKKIINFSRDLNSYEGFLVVCAWPDPRLCPVLGAGWKILFKSTTAGDQEVMRTWKLGRKAEEARIQIQITVDSSKKSEGPEKFDPTNLINRFLSMNSATSFSRNPYEKKAPYFGELSAGSVIEEENLGQHFWVPARKGSDIGNVLVRVTFRKVKFNVDALLLWLNELVLTHREYYDYRHFFPNAGDIYCKVLPGNQEAEHNAKSACSDDQCEIKVGQRLKFGINGAGNLFLDFKLEGDSLGLIHRDNGSLTFTALHAAGESENTLLLVLVDDDTLLSDTRTFIITVKPLPTHEAAASPGDV